ncbi:ComEC/Rec2 family competence protein [uncultured Corynebacterium sp.]|uniref:ComEC/Rec2 family competence protein n=1 Tax=uncultured Corynebacterium sp. TaxID=159447 RepID=UPI0025FD5A8E|nr:ComEC/Rec2 family competence protein [uncultured Corynebacterium sp.]
MPAAVLVWAAVAVTLATMWAWIILVVAIFTAVVAMRRHAPTVALPAVVVLVGVVGTLVRRARATAHPITDEIGGIADTGLTLTTTPRVTDFGATAEASVAGLPGRVRVFGDERLLDHDRGTVLQAMAKVEESDRPSLSGVTVVLRGTVDVVKHPDDHVSRVRDGLRDATDGLPTGPDRLIPAMTLGDERGFSAADSDMMIDSGLAHLSAVSGANVAMITGAAVWAVAWAPPRWRVAVAVVTLAGFVAVVGTEPSVLRAVMTGVVGLLAVLAGRRGQAVPALMAGTIVLLVAFPDLALSAGFALSVAATAGLVLAAAPMTHRLLRVPWLARWPAPIVRALAVTLVAHVATLPILSLVIGRVSHVSVVANLAAAPAVAPVTILGTLAAMAALVGLSPVTWLVVHCAAPFAWWVYAVGQAASRVPGAAGEMGWAGLVIVVVVGAAALRWPAVAAGAIAMAVAAAGVVVTLGWHVPAAPPGWIAGACVIDGRVRVFPPDSPLYDAAPRPCRLSLPRSDGGGDGASGKELEVHGELDDVGGGTSQSRRGSDERKMGQNPEEAEVARVRWFVVADCGQRARGRIRTGDGVPVVCPERDGPQALYADGTVWRGTRPGAADDGKEP